MSRFSCRSIIFSIAGLTASLTGCSWVPNSGPSTAQIERAAANSSQGAGSASGVQIVDVTDDIARKLFAERSSGDFYESLGGGEIFQQKLGVGDTIQISIWEAPPATLFSAATLDSKSGVSGSHVTVLPDQTIDGDGNVSVPFIGAVTAGGRTPIELQREIAGRLKNMAHDPQVLVKLSSNATSYVTIVGDVVNTNRMQLSARGERLLDALANAGGVREPVDKVTIQLTRGNQIVSMPLSSVIRDPRQNIALHAGDVVTALFQPFSFTALGATGKNQEVNFEAQGITLAQALARSGGLDDSRADARGVFIFRFEDPKALNWPNVPVKTTVDGKVPVIYRVNLRDPDALFVTQGFMMDNKDMLYVSNAPISDVQKVLNLVFSVAYPVVTGVQTFK
ncbi:polysaccharide export outer membrane protein [Paraburkholderia eburnea]|uniref:Polysaccharide export outer membrane protein n=1 Tax=Paraburkholderia eburnea TaxID=1189126 RepID=A0A2S4MNH1_9BURK|nr:polysaccharide biosynthesis/export family protein [Paraburkholderia eburnea]POR55897.1 polysaccharide export outer membrane protein [Paraburkholderia eburnea]PRZ27024.1 polysaccharide export outer membrane protein [Paraburkholderia eburnea]